MRSAISSKKRWQSERASICVTTLGCMEEDTEVWGDGEEARGVATLASSYAGKRIIFWRAGPHCRHTILLEYKGQDQAAPGP
jgi:hypothetical protein